MKRELWIAGQSLKGAVEGLNALFCDGENERQISNEEFDELAEKLSTSLSPMMLEDAIDILTAALKKKV
jgi:hypothetical protein